MLIMYFYIEDYDWEVYFFFKVRYIHRNEIMKRLRKLKFREDIIRDSVENLMDLNNGFCYSDFDQQRSIIIINENSSKDEFINSFVHEINHLCSHIEEKFRINPYGEEASYLIGDIAQMIYYKYAHLQ